MNGKRINRNIILSVIAGVCLYACDTNDHLIVNGGHWASYMKDQQNSGASDEELDFPLQNSWVRVFHDHPQAAWPAPAKQDYYNGKRKLEPLVTYDRAYQPIVVADRLYMASSANNSIACYQANSGEELWKFYTESPNRVAPLWYKNKLYVGSDDGHVYCLDAYTGKLQWKRSFGKGRKMIGNGRIISSVPIRTGLVVSGDTLFVAAGLLPEEQVSVNACNVNDGALLWSHDIKDLAPQGYPVLNGDQWIVPNSRVQPMVFSTSTGRLSERLKGDGGANVAVVDGRTVYGVDWQGELEAQRLLESAITGYKVTGDSQRLFVASEFSLTAINVEHFTNNYKAQDKIEIQLKALASHMKGTSIDGINQLDSLRQALEGLKADKFNWQTEISKPYAMIKAANAVITGLQDKVVAYDTKSGQKVWGASVKGRPYGLAICGQKLFVSTDKGVMYCFGEQGDGLYYDEAHQAHTIKNDKSLSEEISHIIHILPRQKGLALVMGHQAMSLTQQLVGVSQYNWVALASSESQTAEVRRRLDQAGLYGKRSTVFNGTLSEQQFSDYLFNVIVVNTPLNELKIEDAGIEFLRILSPSGGRLILSKSNTSDAIERLLEACNQQLTLIDDQKAWVLKRKALPQSGEWTHLYANAANTVSTTDAYASDTVRPLWFGQPGPREMSDRHHRAAAPLFKNGIMFVPGDNGVLGADAYNGTMLWKREIPHFRRIKIARDAGNVALDDERVYAVADNFCYVLDQSTGEEKKVIRVPQIKYGGMDAHWGYLASVDQMLIGSGRKPTAIFNQYSRLDWGEYSELVTSDYLFGLNKSTAQNKWFYKGGAILTASICIGEGKIFFVESRSEKALKDADGLIAFSAMRDKLFVVAIDMHTGKALWKTPFDDTLVEHYLFGSYADGKLIMAGSGNVKGSLWYGTYAFDSDSGQKAWKNSQMHLTWTNGSHGEQCHRALIMDGVVYTEPFAYDLATGEKKADWKLNRNGHSCGTLSGADGVLFFRGANPAACVPAETDQGKQLNNTTRPGCWINMIPAGGLLMIPEASSGCSCNFPLQMTIVYQPLKKSSL